METPIESNAAPSVDVPRRVRRPSPRERVARQLFVFGIECHADDIEVARRSVLSDSGGYWTVNGKYKGNPFRVSSPYLLTSCQSGFRLVENGREYTLYGDAIAIPRMQPATQIEEPWTPNEPAQQRATNDAASREDATGALAAAPCSAVSWTEKPPEKEGWYWIRFAGVEARPVMVSDNGTTLEYYISGMGKFSLFYPPSHFVEFAVCEPPNDRTERPARQPET